MKHDMFDINSLQEDFYTEFKKALGKDGQGKVPESFWESYSAMANTEGGYIILGIAEKKKGYDLIGIPNREKVIKELWAGLNNKQKVSNNLLVDRNVIKRTVNGANIIVIEVPQATRKQKPVFVGNNPLTGTYRRNNDGDYKCPENIVKQMLGEQVNDTNDGTLLEGLTVEDIEENTLKIYRQNFSNRKPTHPFNDYSNEKFLEQIGGFSTDRKTKKQGLTLAGLLMFGKLRSILNVVPNYILDYQERSASETDKRWIDRVTTDFEWSGNLYDYYRIVIKKLTDGLKVPFELKGDTRIEDTPVHEALREALVNTIIHADYSAQCSILVVKRPDLFGFRNPGLLRIPLFIALRGGTSDCRNRNLQKMFQLSGLGEQAGSGMPKIYRNWKNQHWRKPLLEQRIEENQTLMVLTMLSLFPEKKVEEIKEQIGEAVFDNLKNTEQLAIVLAKTDGSVTHQRLKELSKEHPKDLSDILHGLVEKKLLESEGHGRGTSYCLPGKHLAGEFIGGDSMVEGSEHLSKSSEHLSKSFEHLSKSSEHLEVLKSISETVRNSKKAPKVVVENVIRQLCDICYLSLRELAELLNRSPDSIRNHYLKPMIIKGLIEPQMKDRINHPKQKYRSINKKKLG